MGIEINVKLKNRNEDTEKNLKDLQHKILKDQLDNFHNFNDNDKDVFINNLPKEE